MRAHAQRLWDIRVASAAFLRTAAWIHRDKLAPGPFCLGCKDRSELCPRDVADLFGQHAAGEAFDVEIFDCDGLVFLHQASGHLVEKVRARVPHFSVLTSEDSDGFTSTPGPAFSTRHPPLGTGDFSLRPLQQSWILDTRTVGSSSEGFDADVHADMASGSWQWLRWYFVAGQASVPVTIAIGAWRRYRWQRL